MAAKHRFSTRRDLIRRATNQYWVDAIGVSSVAVASGAPVAIRLANVNLNGDYDAKLKGATIMVVRGSIAASADTTGGSAGSTLVAGLLVDENSVTAANLDPTTASGRVRSWMDQQHWFYATAAASNPSGNVFEVRRDWNVKSRRIVPSNDHDLVLVLGANGSATQSWEVRYHARILVRVP